MSASCMMPRDLVAVALQTLSPFHRALVEEAVVNGASEHFLMRQYGLGAPRSGSVLQMVWQHCEWLCWTGA